LSWLNQITAFKFRACNPKASVVSRHQHTTSDANKQKTGERQTGFVRAHVSRVLFAFDLTMAPGASSKPLFRSHFLSFSLIPMNPTLPLHMAHGKGKTIPIKLLSSAGTGFLYTTRKNVVRTPDKIALVKYDPVVRRRVLFNEHKIK
jgi:large subunit ribosomal protein L33